MTVSPPVDAVSRRRFLDRGVLASATACHLSSLPAALLTHLGPRRRSALARRKWTGAGLIGSVVGAATYFALPTAIAHSVWAVAAGAAVAVGVSHRAEAVLGSHDDARIVIDEWIGAWVALIGTASEGLLPGVAAFLLFRFFDVFKGPWGRALQRLPGGWGVVADDLAAAVLANATVRGALLLGGAA